MELKQLLYFTTVAEQGSISGAAKALFMSQPPLSAQMKLLERELGCALLERSARGIELTAAGRRLYEKAAVLLELSRVAKQEVLEYAQSAAGTIRMGVVSSVEAMAARWIAPFSRLRPDLRFELHEANTYELIEKLKADIVQLAVVRTPYTAQGLRVRTLSCERIVAVANERYFVPGEATVSLTALSARPVLLYRRWEAIIRAEFDRAGLLLDCRTICDDARTAIGLARHGMGVALAPASAAPAEAGTDVVCRELSGCEIESRIELACREGACLAPGAAAFERYLLSLFAQATSAAE